jgi:hypothetical protein
MEQIQLLRQVLVATQIGAGLPTAGMKTGEMKSLLPLYDRLPIRFRWVLPLQMPVHHSLPLVTCKSYIAVALHIQHSPAHIAG